MITTVQVDQHLTECRQELYNCILMSRRGEDYEKLNNKALIALSTCFMFLRAFKDQEEQKDWLIPSEVINGMSADELRAKLKEILKV
jgi:hypothetical protein